jgi:hypothetical protein
MRTQDPARNLRQRVPSPLRRRGCVILAYLPRPKVASSINDPGSASGIGTPSRRVGDSPTLQHRRHQSHRLPSGPRRNREGTRRLQSTRLPSERTSGAVPVPSDRCPVRAPHGAIPLPPVACRVDDHGPARFRGASTQPVHAPRNEMERGTDTDHSAEYFRQCLSFVPVVQVPSLTVMVGEARIRGSLSHRVVQQPSPGVGRVGVDHGEPLVNHIAHPTVILGSAWKAHGHAELARSGDDAVPIFGPVIGERRREENRIFAVRVELHKHITSPWSHEFLHRERPPRGHQARRS